jgi:hypothetical protein
VTIPLPPSQHEALVVKTDAEFGDFGRNAASVVGDRHHDATVILRIGYVLIVMKPPSGDRIARIDGGRE